MAQSILSRKLDLLYLVFFVVHIPIMFFVDLVPYYPTSIQPAFAMRLRKWYIDGYRDRFFVQPTAFFHAYAFLEAFYHVPLTFWAIGALLRDDPQVPLQLLVFALETAVTTLTCMVEMLAWEGYTREEQWLLLSNYIPYLGLPTLMAVDMFFRLRRVVSEHASMTTVKKRT